MIRWIPFFLLLVACSPMQAKHVGEDFFTRVNIWYQDINNIQSTNYHSGSFLPANSRVKLLRLTGSVIVFQDEYDTRYTMIHNKGYVNISMDALFARLFSVKPVMGEGTAYENFSELEKRNISSGSLETGMSREATIMAYGYPPTHKTPSLKSNQWQFWDARLTRKLVYFRDDRIREVKKYIVGQFLFK